MTHAEEIKSIRQSLGITQTALAAKLGVTWRAVAYWEAGTRKPSASAMILARSLKSRGNRG